MHLLKLFPIITIAPGVILIGDSCSLTEWKEGTVAAAAVKVVAVAWGGGPVKVGAVVAAEPNQTEGAAEPYQTEGAAELNRTEGVVAPVVVVKAEVVVGVKAEVGVGVEAEVGVGVALGVIGEAVLAAVLM